MPDCGQFAAANRALKASWMPMKPKLASRGFPTNPGQPDQPRFWSAIGKGGHPGPFRGCQPEPVNLSQPEPAKVAPDR